MDEERRFEKIYSQISMGGKSCRVKRIVLFGSRARGTNQPKSDIDLAVYGCTDILEFRQRLEEEVETLLRFDLVDMEQADISQELIEAIERDGVVIYEEI